MFTKIENATYSYPNQIYINEENIKSLLEHQYDSNPVWGGIYDYNSYDKDYRFKFSDFHEKVCKLAIVYNKEINLDDNCDEFVRYTNLKALDEYFDFNENMFSNLKNLAELLFKMFTEKINDYHVFIIYNNKKEIKDIIHEDYCEAYLFNCLYKLIAITPDDVEFKIYLATESEFNDIKKKNIDDISKYDYIDLFKNRKNCKEYYGDNKKDKEYSLLYYIIILMLGLNKEGLNRKQYSKMLYNVVKLIERLKKEAE